MSRKYKFHEAEGLYFVTFATIGWVDALTRPKQKEILLESIRHCQREKGLRLSAWVVMSNHVHLVCQAAGPQTLPEIFRDLKKFTSRQLIASLQEPGESRAEWMLPLFRQAGAANPNNRHVQFWQQDNHPIVIQGEGDVPAKVDYIHDNPVKAGIVAEAHHYLYSSAHEARLLDLVY
ncbi:MAG: transposase [Pseudomonadales bacterium]|nr:transposase [Pseudomonadales bacterium]